MRDVKVKQRVGRIQMFFSVWTKIVWPICGSLKETEKLEA